jgi:hypothetical protein
MLYLISLSSRYVRSASCYQGWEVLIVGENGQYITERSTNFRRGTFQVDAGPNGNGEGQIPSKELRPYKVT